MSLPKFVNGMVVGAIAGAAVSWFLHSETGQELIDDAHYAALNVRDKVTEKADALKEATRQKAGAVKSQLSTVVQRAKDVVGHKGDDPQSDEDKSPNNSQLSFS